MVTRSIPTTRVLGMISLLGACAASVSFVVYLSLDAHRLLVFPEILAFGLVPFAGLWLVALGVIRLFAMEAWVRGAAMVALLIATFVVAFEHMVAFKINFIEPFDPEAGEPNLVFLLGPIHQLVVGLLLLATITFVAVLRAGIRRLQKTS